MQSTFRCSLLHCLLELQCENWIKQLLRISCLLENRKTNSQRFEFCPAPDAYLISGKEMVVIVFEPRIRNDQLK